MKTLEELLAEMDAHIASMREIAGKSATEADPSRRAGFEALYAGKAEELKVLETKVNQAKEFRRLENEIAATRRELTPEGSGGKTLNPGGGKVREGAKDLLTTNEDPVMHELEKADAFFGYVQGKAFTDNERALEGIRCKDSRVDADFAVKLPGSMAASITGLPYNGVDIAKAMSLRALGHFREGGKVVLSTDATGGSTDSNANKTLAPQFVPSLLRQPVSAPNLVDLVRPLQAVNGKATWPMLDQAQGNFGGVAFTWKTTEGADKAETEPVFKDFEIKTAELSGWTELSNTALRRSALDLQSLLTELFREATRYEWSQKILRGDGTGDKPLGVVLDTGVTQIDRLVSGQVSYGDLVALEYAISQGNRLNGRYIIDDLVEQGFKNEVDAMNRPLFGADVNSNIKNLLNGYGYLAHEYGPDLGTEGDIIFGNWNNYGFAVEEDIAIARSDHAEFKKGRVVFRLMCFVGGKAIFPGAFARLNA